VRFTIERLRTIVLVAGVLLVAALGAFLALGRWKNALLKNRDIPKRLGIDISSESNGVTYTQSHGGHTIYKIHASKVVQLKNDHALLHDVDIELYGPDGSRTDRIAGNEFEYDQQAQVAKAAGPVEITMMRPAPVPPAKAKRAGSPAKPGAQAAPDQIHVKTSGLSFDRKTGIATTDQHVDFSVTQGSGTAVGATYDSQQAHLVLDRQVELHLERNGEAVTVHANHAEFERGDMICNLRGAEAQYRNGEATAGKATIVFRQDGSAVRLDAADGFTMSTATGGRVTAPKGWLVFNERNQPQQGHLEGGVAMDSLTHTDQSDRRAHGTSPTAELAFTEDGELRHAHLERGVELTSDEQSVGESEPFRATRTWQSPVADVEFRPSTDNSRVEPEWIHGVGGVSIKATTQTGNGPTLPSRMAAEDVTVNLGPGGALSELKGAGQASLEETTSTGTRQTSSGDRLDAHFAPAAAASAAPGTGAATLPGREHRPPAAGAAQIESATLDGHVVITQQPAAKPGEAATTMRATSGHADYDSTGEWMHLTQVPMVTDGSMQLAADKIDVSQATGEAFAHGKVKATWLAQNASIQDGPKGASASKTMAGLGGQGPSHVVADEAEVNQSTGLATFRGNARLWQDANSVAGPMIAINRLKETLVATSRDPRNPVRIVLVSARGRLNAPDKSASNKTESSKDRSKNGEPSVIRVRGGTLRYSDAEHKALVSAMAGGRVEAETGTADTVADEVELTLLPPGNHAGKDGGAAQVDTMTARGHVVVTSQDRRGTGTKLVYTGETEDYVLTGTADSPPKLTDPVKGNVTGEALIFHSRDDSVSIEGGGNQTVTETRTPK
jgi:lipopolysaccharide export system protein LptA